MNLIVVESPTKARTLSRFLGEDYDVEATMGHIKDLPKSELGIDIKNNFQPAYELIPKKKEMVERLKVKSQKAKVIYLATDPDREGEAIAHHVREILPVSQYPSILISRIIFHEITKEAVEDAIKNPRDVDGSLVDAQIARRVLDRLVGYKLSPLLWRKVRRGLSAGRVQSVTVRLVVEREREIEKFNPEEYWEIFAKVAQVAKVSKVAQVFTVQLIKVEGRKAEIKDGEFAKKIVADLEKANYEVFDVEKREVSKNPYPPFTTSTMTQAAARLFFWSAKKTMSIAQRLYEEGLITYHRTDSVNLARQAVEKVRQFIRLNYGEEYLPGSPRVYKTRSKVAQEAHEAIRPTNVGELLTQNSNVKSQNFSDQKKLYDLIWRRFVACQMAPASYDETVIDVEARSTPEVKSADTSGVYVLRASGQTLRFDGWRAAYGRIPNSQFPISNGEQKLPKVVKDEPLSLIKVDSYQKFTEPPSRFNEASLIKTLEKLGIGRPSTYAPIISTIQIRNYVEKKEGKFFPTPVGMATNDFLVKYFPDVFDYQFTAEMEDGLDDIANGKKKWTDEIKIFWNPFSKKLESVTENSKRVKIEVEKLGKKCPKCNKGELVIRLGRFGKFVSCSSFPECDYTEKYIEKIGLTCPECKVGDVIVKRTKTGRSFYGCSRYPDCKWASWRNPKPQESTQTVGQTS